MRWIRSQLELATYVGNYVVLDLGGQRDEAEEGGHVDLDREGFRG